MRKIHKIRVEQSRQLLRILRMMDHTRPTKKAAASPLDLSSLLDSPERPTAECDQTISSLRAVSPIGR